MELIIKKVSNGYILTSPPDEGGENVEVIEGDFSGDSLDSDIRLLRSVLNHVGESSDRYSKFRVCIGKAIGDKFEGKLTEKEKLEVTERYEDAKSDYNNFVLNK